LSDGARVGTSARVTPPEIFDRHARRLRRDRIAPAWRDHAFLRDWMVEGLIDRLASVTREFRHVLDLGCFDGAPIPGIPADAKITRLDPGFAFARQSGGVQGDEDRLPFADGSFDLVISAGILDQVSDLPGALALARRALKPDGLFLATFLGAGSLPALRAAMRAGDSDRAAARLHPQVDVRSAGDLLVRAGFALPVADVETLDVRYGSLFGLIRDLRGMGATSLLHDRAPLDRAILARAATSFADMAEPDGKVRERFNAIVLTAWSPAPSQPKPARRGSGGASLADALKPRG
jgi:SAM-dependent methyltransferase